MPDGDRFVMIDTETFGLDPNQDFIIELGVLIVDMELETIDRKSWMVWDTPEYDRRFQQLEEDARNGDETSKYVWDMHAKSGLWDAASSFGLPVEDVTNEAANFLEGHGVGKSDPMVGSSVQFDRQMLLAQMPLVHEQFSYRNIDSSTIKELCRRLNPKIYEKLDATTHPMKIHRVDPDLDDSREELRFYIDNFLWTA